MRSDEGALLKDVSKQASAKVKYGGR